MLIKRRQNEQSDGLIEPVFQAQMAESRYPSFSVLPLLPATLPLVTGLVVGFIGLALFFVPLILKGQNHKSVQTKAASDSIDERQGTLYTATIGTIAWIEGMDMDIRSLQKIGAVVAVVVLFLAIVWVWFCWPAPSSSFPPASAPTTPMLPLPYHVPSPTTVHL